eukprot:3243031-Rhodomonas_salina.2
MAADLHLRDLGAQVSLRSCHTSSPLSAVHGVQSCCLLTSSFWQARNTGISGEGCRALGRSESQS